MFDTEFKNFKLYSRFLNNLNKNRSFVISGLTSFLRILTVEKIKSVSGKNILFIVEDEQKALKYQNVLKQIYDKDSEILPFQNVSLYDTVSPNLYDYIAQLEVLNSNSEFVIAPVKSLLEKFPSKSFFIKNSINLSVGDELDMKTFILCLTNLGYKRSTMVSDIGEFSVRGDIIDVFSLTKYPLRIELWGDEIVDLRFFNNETQRSIEKTKASVILPVYKFVSKNLSEKLPDQLHEKYEEEGYFEGVEVYQSYFNENLVSVFDYLNDYIVVFDEMSEIYSKYELISQNYENQYLENLKTGLIYEIKEKNHFEISDLNSQVQGMEKVGLNNFIDFNYEDLIEFESQSLKNYFTNLESIANFVKEKLDYKLYAATDFPQRVKEFFEQQGIFNIEILPSIPFSGCMIKDLKIILLTDRELFNKRTKEITSAKRSYYKEKQEFIDSINDIQEGEYVVHSVHGIGLYKGLCQQEIDGQYKDYLTIEYAKGDLLHMPAEQVNLLCRYRGSGNLKPTLSRMGGSDWTNIKTKVKKEVEKIAYDLLRLYARRKMQEGIIFEPDTPWQIEMEEAFEYVETPDQMKAINDVKHDMEEPMPMDRLICGDVGFGKTEVAMRAMFKAVASGKQVALIVPTTILAMQHFKTIEERFKPFGVNVQLLCRFRSQKEQKETLKDLSMGKCDVIIATHRVLQKDVVFKNLGLLVIDEEHRFGVRHKERLKELRENIDIITMSATPIPRTLYMSLSGIKDMSVINTPPKNRLQVKTFVGEFNETALKNAIMHELDRDGQIFYLYNRVESIQEYKLYLQKLIPNARIAVGHAQMDEKLLEQVMVDFAEREYDILLCTTIIESGLDIPNANTIIIHDADKFGLAQLYQLRGRVGRSERQAYCYCFYQKNKVLTKEASQRLKAIKEFSTLGSGYQIALRDIEIRGVGNILGTKQHGHMVNVGFDTYCQLLEETVNELKGEHIEAVQPAIVDLNVTAFIPDDWVGSKEQKMIEYKKLADVKSVTELDYITQEWQDRFSKIPESVDNLIKLIRIRLSATDAKITAIRETQDNIRIYTPYSKAEYNIIKSKLPSNITKYVKFTEAPKSCTEGISVILLNNKYMNFDELFNILSDLFYYIHKTVHEYI